MDVISFSKLAFSLLFVLSLMGGLALILRYMDQRGGLTTFKAANDKKRLGIVERLTIDRQKTAIILRIDDREDLVISSSLGDTVLESNQSDGSIVPLSSAYSENKKLSADSKSRRKAVQDPAYPEQSA